MTARYTKEANARAQAEWRARRKAKLIEQERQIAELKAKLDAVARVIDPTPVGQASALKEGMK